tara:strand:- start:1072 stop:1761 length:690 start_codon:yes stop_codon:yes gene_type:complete
MRKKIHFYLNDVKDRYAIMIDVFLYLIIFLNIIDNSLMTMESMHKYRSFSDSWNYIPLIFFSVEYLLRVYSNPNRLKFIFSFWGIIDFFALIGLHEVGPKILREIRILRFISLFKYEPAAMNIYKTFGKIKKELFYFSLLTIFMIYISSVGIWYFEYPTNSENFPNIFDSMWWSIVTLSTVGYGDVYPITEGGKIFASFLIIIGLALFAIPAGLVAGAFSDVFKKKPKD